MTAPIYHTRYDRELPLRAPEGAWFVCRVGCISHNGDTGLSRERYITLYTLSEADADRVIKAWNGLSRSMKHAVHTYWRERS